MGGAPPDIQDINGFTPLHIASQQNGFDCVMVLLNIGVDVNVPTVAGLTPLYLAHAAGSTQCYSLLSEHKAKLIHDSQVKLAGSTVLDPAPGRRRWEDDHY